MFGLIMSLGCILLYSALSCCMVVLTSLSSDLLAVSFIGRSLFVESSPYAYYVTNRFRGDLEVTLDETMPCVFFCF